MDTIREAVENLREAMVGADELALRDITLDELSYGHASGLVENKDEFVGAIAGSKRRDVFHSIELSDQTIQISGDTAIVRHNFKAEVSINGVLAHPDIRVMQVWELRQGKWKLLARQAFKV